MTQNGTEWRQCVIENFSKLFLKAKEKVLLKKDYFGWKTQKRVSNWCQLDYALGYGDVAYLESVTIIGCWWHNFATSIDVTGAIRQSEGDLWVSIWNPITATPWVKVADIPEETTTSVTSTTTTATTLTTTTNEEAIDELIIELHSESLDEPK